MAEYAGLEIRIGGNTTKLTNALKASTKSAAELQSRIRQITRAMQFDPTDLKNVETRIKITGDRMQSLQSKAQLTKTAMEQLGDSFTHFKNDDGTSKTVRQVAEEAKNLSLEAKQADERFNKLTGTLAKIYETWNNVSRSEGADFLSDNLGISAADADRLMKSTTSMREFKTELKQIQDLRASISYNGQEPMISDADIENAAKFKELNFHNMFKRGMGLDEMIQQASDLGVVIEDSAIANVRELQKTFNEAQQDKKAFDDALRFEQLGTDIQRINSEVESLSQTARSLDDSLTLTGMSDEFQDIETEIRKIDAALDSVDDDLKRTGEAMKADPKDIRLAARYCDDLQQKANLSEEKMNLLNKQISMLDADGASEAAKGHKDLAKWIEESAESARQAKKDLLEQGAAVNNLQDQTETLKQKIATLKGDTTIAQYSEGVIQWQKQTQKLNDKMQELAKAEQNVATQQEELSKAKDDFDGATKSAENLKTQLDNLQREYGELSSAYNKVYDDPSVDYDTKLGMYNRLNDLETEINAVDTAYKGAQTNVKEFSKALEDQKERANIAASSMDQVKDGVDDLKRAVADLEKTPDVKLFKNPTGEIEKLEGELNELDGELDEAKAKENELEAAYSAAKTENELAKTAKAARELAGDMDDAKLSAKEAKDELAIKAGDIFNSSTIKSVGMTLSATVTPAVTALGYKMVDASATVDAAYRDMRKTVEGTDEQFEELRKGAVDFSRTHVTSADQILEIEAIGGELGVATESLQTFAEVISNIDVATNLDTESAAEALGHLSNILHLTEKDYVGFSDALVRLGNNGASTETEIANIAERIGSMGSIVGMSGSDILAWSSSIASTGQRAEAAGTAISRTLSFFETAVASAGGTMDTSFDAINAAVQEGGDKLTVFASLSGMTAEEFAEGWEANSKEMADSIKEQVDGAKDSLQMIADVAHMSADDFAKAWEDDPTQVLQAFIEGLNDIEGSGGSADKVLQDLGITAVRQKQAIEGLMQTVGGLDDNLKMSEDAWNGISDEWGKAGDAANEAQKKAEGFSGQMQILKNIWQNFLSELGEGAAPWIKGISGKIETLSKLFSNLSVDTKKWIVFLGGLSAAVGPALSIGASFANAGKEFKDWFGGVTSGMNLVKLAMKHGSGDITSALDGTMTTMQKVKLVGAEMGSTLVSLFTKGAILAGVAALTWTLSQLYDRYQDHITATEGLSNALDNVGVAAKDAANGISEAGGAVQDLYTGASGYESRLADLASTIEDSNRQYGTLAGQLEYYGGVVSDLGGKSDRSQDETYKLAAALQAVNDACGTTYGIDEYGNIIDTDTGKIQKNTDALSANIELRKQQAIIDYYSDDYAKAIGEQAEAQSKLNDAIAEMQTDRSESGKAAWIDNYIEKTGRADLANEAYEQHMDRLARTVSSYQQEVQGTTETVDVLEGKIASASEEMAKATQVVDDAKRAQEEFDQRNATVAADVTGNMKRLSDTMEGMGKSDTDFNFITQGLEAIKAGANELNGVDMTALADAFSDVNGSMGEVISALEDGGVQMNTWNKALEQAPEAAEHMGSLTASAFQTMYESTGQNLNDTMTLIAGLDEVKVDDKTFYIGDNGSITDEQGKVYDIKGDLASIPPEVVTQYYIDDKDAQKKALDAQKKTDKFGKQDKKAKLGVKDNASKPTKAVQSLLNKVGNTKSNPVVKLTDLASSGIKSISRSLNSLDGDTATVTVYQKTVKSGGKSQATGGLNSVPVIPEHASGYIATGPTMTNQGWIGEDGVEAVTNWATGGAVVPLTNKRYMLPIADAIADGMVKRTGAIGNGPQVNITITGVESPDDVAQAVTRQLALLDL